MYAIKDSIHGGYYTGMAAIGPMMGGDADEAVTFDSKEIAADVAIWFPMQVLWEIEELND